MRSYVWTVQKALRFHKKAFFLLWRLMKVFCVWNDMRVNDIMFIFGWIIHLRHSSLINILFMLWLLMEHWHPLVDCNSPCKSKPCSLDELLLPIRLVCHRYNSNSPKPWMFYNPALPCLHIQPSKCKTAFLYDTILPSTSESRTHRNNSGMHLWMCSAFNILILYS